MTSFTRYSGCGGGGGAQGSPYGTMGVYERVIHSNLAYKVYIKGEGWHGGIPWGHLKVSHKSLFHLDISSIPQKYICVNHEAIFGTLLSYFNNFINTKWFMSIHPKNVIVSQSLICGYTIKAIHFRSSIYLNAYMRIVCSLRIICVVCSIMLITILYIGLE